MNVKEVYAVEDDTNLDIFMKQFNHPNLTTVPKPIKPKVIIPKFEPEPNLEQDSVLKSEIIAILTDEPSSIVSLPKIDGPVIIDPSITRAALETLMMQSNDAIGQVLSLIHKNQTMDEKQQGTVLKANGKGFIPGHARLGSSMAEFYQTKGFLSDKQCAVWRRENMAGIPKIFKYAMQAIKTIKMGNM